ncbi:MAG TPA: phosphoglucosamine mutase [Candidatus Coprenecus stercoravium]|uniref:Phosphoglucosamine mutase n=1 Tax=Candidatus Coprenecus stercoravium TaxID=2840735 RepID=A0A9D2GQH8_9BACT|nr:phosphoglucosamine mutase [Candidatus Coprenecus stercoravium]
MTLIKSISGIRGTIGGVCGEALTPLDIVKFVSAYASMLGRGAQGKRQKVVVGRDARISGPMVEEIVCGTLRACGIDVVNAGLASTPTVEMAVVFENADGGIILTASHNPKQWNALKLLNSRGEFLNAEEGAELVSIAGKEEFTYCDVDSLGGYEEKDFTARHIQAVLSYPLVNVEAVRARHFKVVVDAVNSVGGIIVPELLKALGAECVEINCGPTGQFAHNPEPLPSHLMELCGAVAECRADLGIAVDPDVDRLALVCEDGTFFGEEYTLVSVADYVLSHKPGPTVSNLSSSRALRDVTEAHGCTYTASAVGEVNVTAEMKRTGAVIGGEGNGGVIVPDLHYGRDAIIGIALFLSRLAENGEKVSDLRASLPRYSISKNRIELSDSALIDKVLREIKEIYASERITDIDGVKIDFDKERMWVHLRKSNTEPIIRVYSEASDEIKAEQIAGEVMSIVKKITE